MKESLKIHRIAQSMIKSEGTNDPFILAQRRGIEVLFCSGFGSLKGMFRVIKKVPFIFINKDMDEYQQTLVCAHELGHAVLHREYAMNNPVQEYTLYDMQSKPEYEANIFAASLLIDVEELTDYIYTYNYSAEQIARAMGTDINLIALMIAYLIEIGYDLRPQEYRNRFLGE